METTQETNAIVLHIEQNGLEADTAKSLKESFMPFFEKAEEWKQKADALVVNDVSQVNEMKQAREARLALKSIRVEVENTRKKLKEDSLRKGKAIDGIANVIKYLIEPIEESLEQKEKFAEIQEAKRKEQIRSEREAELKAYNADVQFVDLANMPEESYQKFLESAKMIQAQRIEAERKAEEEKKRAEAWEKLRWKRADEIRPYYDFFDESVKLADLSEIEYSDLLASLKEAKATHDAEQERIRLENKRLKKEKEEHEAKLKKEREEREKVEAELRAKKEAEEKARLEAEAKAEEDLNKGDKAKFMDLLSDLELLKYKYQFKSKKYTKIQTQINELLEKTIVFGRSKI